MKEVEGGKYPRPRLNYIAIPCQHCQNALCVDAGKDGAVYRREDGIVIIDPEKAKGQRQTVASCPYRVIYWNVDLQLPQKCGLAAAPRHWRQEPRCVVLPNGRHGVRRPRRSPVEISQRMREVETEVFHPEYGPAPSWSTPASRVAWWPARSSWRAVTSMRRASRSRSRATASPGEASKTFGDFEFERLPQNKTFKVTVAADGYKPQVFDVRTDTDVDLGEVVLTR